MDIWVLKMLPKDLQNIFFTVTQNQCQNLFVRIVMRLHTRICFYIYSRHKHRFNRFILSSQVLCQIPSDLMSTAALAYDLIGLCAK